jgi:pentatricopeptide repeat protein
MSLLTHLKHNPAAHSHLTSITNMLIASYFKKHKPKEALKVFNWMVRPGSPCMLDEKVCGILVYGFCKQGIVLEALKFLRAMVGVNLVPGRDLGTWVYRGLLREARIKEALELNEALGLVKDVGDAVVKKVLGLLDHMIVLCVGKLIINCNQFPHSPLCKIQV